MVLRMKEMPSASGLASASSPPDLPSHLRADSRANTVMRTGNASPEPRQVVLSLCLVTRVEFWERRCYSC